MSELRISLAVEDDLSEVVLRQILRRSGRPYAVARCLKRGGFGYLRKKIRDFNNAAKNGLAFLVLTDMDNIASCPPAKIRTWLSEPIHPNLLFRVAVVEVESWVMAHREGFANYLGVDVVQIPQNVDSISDPKRWLVNLARRSRDRSLRQDLVPATGATSQTGPNYNARLTSFVEDHWDLEEAIPNSESLRRAVQRIRLYQPVREREG